MDHAQFLGRVAGYRADGWRLVLINATSVLPGEELEAGAVEISWTFAEGNRLEHVRERVLPGETVPSISEAYGAAFLYENEILRAVRRGRQGHQRRPARPALPNRDPRAVLARRHPGATRGERPARGARPGARETDRFGDEAGAVGGWSMKRTIVPFGPQHPVLPEPLVLDLILEDERVIDAVPTIGYVHRGLEAMVERVEYTEMGYVVERICGICSFQHGMGYCISIEDLMGVEVPERAHWLRLIWAEMARVQSHLLWLGLGADAFGFENLFMHCWRMREELLDIFEQTTGGRIIHSVNKIGGVRRDISDSELKAILHRLEVLAAGFAETAHVFQTDPSIRHRLSGVGVLSADEAQAVGAVGPMARASGMAFDVRVGGRYPYDQLDFEPILETDGDCLARVLVRAREIGQSVNLVRQLIEKMPKGDDQPVDTKVRGFPGGEVFTRLEQPRGEVVYYIKANGTKYLERFRARTPTFANIPAMIKLVKGCDLADVPNIILTIDPCISCTER